MRTVVNFVYNTLKFFYYKWRIFSNSICNGRLFDGVEFKNSDFISIGKTSNIERGSVLKVLNTEERKKNKISVRDYCWIGKNVEIDTGPYDQVIIDDYVSIQDRCKILGSVSIGKYCILAPDIFISSGNHYYKESPFITIRQQDSERSHLIESTANTLKSIIIEEDCWIGKNVFIASGVYIGRGAIIGTNSIVKNDILPYSICIGSPAIKLKERISFKPLREISPFNVENLPYFYRGFQHYVPNRDILDIIKINSGILSENKSLVLLEKFEWKEVIVKGFIINGRGLKIHIDGTTFEGFSENGYEFEFKILKEVSLSLPNSNLDDLPKILRSYVCIQFELVSNETSNKYNFIISNISIL